jgi:hypothetical protein
MFTFSVCRLTDYPDLYDENRKIIVNCQEKYAKMQVGDKTLAGSILQIEPAKVGTH